MALMILSFTPASFNRIRSWVSVLKLVAEVAILLRMISSESLAFCIWTMSSLVSTVPGPELRSAALSTGMPATVRGWGSSMRASPVARAGARVIRGGAFKPRSSPYSFQGLGGEGLQMLRAAADRNGLIVVSEVMDQTQIPLVAEYSDILQVGARNMQNFNLLRELGKLRKPVLLKRGIAATIEELLLSAEYIMAGGNYDVILCERGIRTFETYTRNTMDISAIPVVKKLSH